MREFQTVHKFSTFSHKISSKFAYLKKTAHIKHAQAYKEHK